MDIYDFMDRQSKLLRYKSLGGSLSEPLKFCGKTVPTIYSTRQVSSKGMNFVQLNTSLNQDDSNYYIWSSFVSDSDYKIIQGLGINTTDNVNN